jgi:sodium-dependent dicarboxylate transporter 2/3/5
MAFMMPVATPPNAIVFASGRLLIRDMIKTGFIINIIAIILITALTWFVGRAIFDIDLATMPLWAR